MDSPTPRLAGRTLFRLWNLAAGIWSVDVGHGGTWSRNLGMAVLRKPRIAPFIEREKRDRFERFRMDGDEALGLVSSVA